MNRSPLPSRSTPGWLPRSLVALQAALILIAALAPAALAPSARAGAVALPFRSPGVRPAHRGTPTAGRQRPTRRVDRGRRPGHQRRPGGQRRAAHPWPAGRPLSVRRRGAAAPRRRPALHPLCPDRAVRQPHLRRPGQRRRRSSPPSRSHIRSHDAYSPIVAVVAERPRERPAPGHRCDGQPERDDDHRHPALAGRPSAARRGLGGDRPTRLAGRRRGAAEPGAARGTQAVDRRRRAADDPRRHDRRGHAAWLWRRPAAVRPSDHSRCRACRRGRAARLAAHRRGRAFRRSPVR